MQTENESAIQSAETTDEGKGLSREQINEMVRNRDLDGLEKLDPDAEGTSEQGSTGTGQPGAEEGGQAAATQPGEPVGASSGAAAPEKKKYAFKYADEDNELPDEDGFLGYKDVDGLKRKAAHEHSHIKRIERENAEARQAADEAVRKQREFEAELAELRQSKASWEVSRASQGTQQPAQPEQGQASAAQASQAAAARAEIPEAPKPPEEPFDPETMTAEAAGKWNKYHHDIADFNSKVATALRSQPAPTNVDPKMFDAEIERRVSERVKPLEEKLSKSEQAFTTWQTENAQKQAQREESAMWDNFSQFQTKHKAFVTERPLRQVHDEVNSWSDRVAKECGHTLPYGATPQQREQYIDARQRCVQGFLDQDPGIINRVQGIDPPEGYEQYYQIAAINRVATEHKLPLNQAMAVWLTQTGKLESGMESLRVSSEQAGRESIGKAIADGGRLAKPIPSSVGNRQEAETNANADLQASIDQARMLRDPEYRKMVNELGAKQGWD